MGWAGHVEHIRSMGNTSKMLSGKPEGKKQLGSSRLDGRIIFKCNLEK
jgi:hypothetical protein